MDAAQRRDCILALNILHNHVNKFKRNIDRLNSLSMLREKQVLPEEQQFVAMLKERQITKKLIKKVAINLNEHFERKPLV